MDCDYPVPDIYDCNSCPFEGYIPNPDCQEDVCSQERGKGNTTEFPSEFRDTWGECGEGTIQGKGASLRFAVPQKEIAILRKLSITPDNDKEEKDSTPPKYCCSHKKEKDVPQRTFFLTFNNRGDDDCMMIEKNRCKSFWDFIDSEEILKSLIKDGEFFYENPPQPVDGNKRISRSRGRKGTAQKASESEQQHKWLIQAEINRATHEEEERRFDNQRQKNLELRQKSGQFQLSRKEKVNYITPRKENKYADTCEPSFEEVMREMQMFDKRTKNPVRMPDP